MTTSNPLAPRGARDREFSIIRDGLDEKTIKDNRLLVSRDGRTIHGHKSGLRSKAHYAAYVLSTPIRLIWRGLGLGEIDDPRLNYGSRIAERREANARAMDIIHDAVDADMGSIFADRFKDRFDYLGQTQHGGVSITVMDNYQDGFRNRLQRYDRTGAGAYALRDDLKRLDIQTTPNEIRGQLEKIFEKYADADGEYGNIFTDEELSKLEHYKKQLDNMTEMVQPTDDDPSKLANLAREWRDEISSDIHDMVTAKITHSVNTFFDEVDPLWNPDAKNNVADAGSNATIEEHDDVSTEDVDDNEPEYYPGMYTNDAASKQVQSAKQSDAASPAQDVTHQEKREQLRAKFDELRDLAYTDTTYTKLTKRRQKARRIACQELVEFMFPKSPNSDDRTNPFGVREASMKMILESHQKIEASMNRSIDFGGDNKFPLPSSVDVRDLMDLQGELLNQQVALNMATY